MTEAFSNPPDVRFGLWYDFRNPDPARPFTQFYREVLDQISFAEEIGLDSVWLTEHHFCDDGYTPSPLVLAAAIGERTERMQIGTNLMIAALHNPIRLAEDAATLSLLTDGRFDLGLGQGYWRREFEAFGRPLSHRPSLLEEAVTVIRQAWSGSCEGYTGKRHSKPALSVTPQPEKLPKLLVGAMAEPAIERAARIADGFLSTQNVHHEAYLRSVDKLGGDSDQATIYAGQWVIVDDDPERAWATAGPHAVAQLNNYISWGAFGPPEEIPEFPDPQAVLDAGAYTVWDPDTAVHELTALLRSTPQVRDVHFFPQLPGEPVAAGTQRIECFANRVVPRVREALLAAQPVAG